MLCSNICTNCCLRKTYLFTFSLTTDFRLVIRQGTWWSSTFSMLHRYFALLEHLDKEKDDIADLIPASACSRRLRYLFKELKDVKSVSNKLQGTDVDLLDVREWFDGLIDVKSKFATYLGKFTALQRVVWQGTLFLCVLSAGVICRFTSCHRPQSRLRLWLCTCAAGQIWSADDGREGSPAPVCCRSHARLRA